MVRLNHFGLSQTVTTTRWHVESLIPKGLGLLAGQPGSAKSILAEYLSWGTVYEQPCLGLTTRSGPVLYINNDHPEDMHRRWLQRFSLGAGIEHDPKYALVTVHHQWPNLQKTQKEVEDVLKKEKPVLMVIDRLSTTLGADEDKAQNVEPVGQLLRQWADTFNLTTIVIHHFTKELTHMNLKWMESTFAKRLRGSGAVLGMADSAMELATTETENERLKEFGVRPHPKRAVVLAPFRVGVVENGQGVTLEFREGWQPVDLELLQIANEALPLFNSGQELTVKEIDAKFAGAYDIRELRQALKCLADKGLLKPNRKGKGGRYVYKKAV